MAVQDCKANVLDFAGEMFTWVFIVKLYPVLYWRTMLYMIVVFKFQINKNKLLLLVILTLCPQLSLEPYSYKK